MESYNSIFSVLSAIVGPLCTLVCLVIGAMVLISKEKITKLLGIWYLSFGLYELANYLMVLSFKLLGDESYMDIIVILGNVFVIFLYTAFVILLIYSKLRYRIKYWVFVALLIVFGPVIYFLLGAYLGYEFPDEISMRTNNTIIGLVFSGYLFVISVGFVCIMISNIRKESKLKAVFLIPLSMAVFSVGKIIIYLENVIGISVGLQTDTSMVVMSIFDIIVILSAVYILCRGPKAAGA